MKSTRLVWALGGTCAVALGMVAGACASNGSDGGSGSESSSSTVAFSSSGGSTSFSTSTTSGESVPLGGSSGSTSSTSGSTGSTDQMDAGGSSSAGGDASSSGSGSGSSSSSGDGGCHKPPTALHPEKDAGVYCPFSSTGDAGDKTCAAGKHCCEPATGTATCSAATTTCAATDTDWRCDGPLDCAGSSAGPVCCGTGTIENQAACGAYPAYEYISKFTGTACAASCTTYIVCSRDSECPGGATGACVAIEPKGGGIGYCAVTSATDAGKPDGSTHLDSGTHADGSTHTDGSAHDASTTCVAAGGTCVALVPGACANGTVGSATMYSCGPGIGDECCLPN